jgi:glyoxylase-like metal-dependent hydrolase (beta-lactamase superfamily II)
MMGPTWLGWGDVRHVILTHYHFDHAGNAADVATLASQATIWAGELALSGNVTPPPHILALQPVRCCIQ